MTDIDYADVSHGEDERWHERPEPYLGEITISPTGTVTTTAKSGLEFQTIRDLLAEVDAAGPRQWLIRGIWPSGAYGVHGGEMKAQKTWNGCDLAVSVASGTPWLNSIPIDAQGPVLMFAGEGGKASIARRLRAVCANRDLDPAELPIVICTRAPHLSDQDHLNDFAAQVEATKPLLVSLDPLYLAAGGAKSSDLYAMGELLERAQHICEAHNAALFVTTHYNRKEGTGPNRFTGAGPAEWGRVLIGTRVISRHTHHETQETTVVFELDIVGGEVPDQTLRYKREIRAENPDDLDSPLNYTIETAPETAEAPKDDLAPAARKLIEALEAQDGPAGQAELVDWIAEHHGHGLRRETVSRNLTALERDGIVTCTNPDSGVMTPKLWALTNTKALQISRDLAMSHETGEDHEDPKHKTPANHDVTNVTSHVTSHTAKPRVTDVISPVGRSHGTVTPEVTQTSALDDIDWT